MIMSTVVVVMVLSRGLSTTPENNGSAYHDFNKLQASATLELSDPSYTVVAGLDSKYGKEGFVKLSKNGEESIWQLNKSTSGYTLEETLFMTKLADGTKLFNGAAKEDGKFFRLVMSVKSLLMAKTLRPLVLLVHLPTSLP